MLLAACSPAEQKAAAPTASEAAPAAADVKKSGDTAIVEHPALDNVRQGVLEELKAQGFEEGKNLQVDFQSAQGSTATAGQIAKKFAGDKPDVIVAIATPSAQSVVAATKSIPVVFAAVTDPVAAKLVSSWRSLQNQCHRRVGRAAALAANRFDEKNRAHAQIGGLCIAPAK